MLTSGGRNSLAREAAGVPLRYSDPTSRRKLLRSSSEKILLKGSKSTKPSLVLWPAVFRNGADGEGGEEIDQEKFENAIGVRGIEQLVGVGVHETRTGWKF